MGKDPFRVRIEGPLAAYRDGLAEDLLRQGYTRQTSALLVRMMAHVARWLAKKSLLPEQFTTQRLEEFVRARRHAGRKQYVTPRGLHSVVGFLQRSGLVPPEEKKTPAPTPLNTLLENYETYLVHERSLSPRVVFRYRSRARRFLDTTLPDKALDFGRLTTVEVSSYILGEVQTSRGGGAKNKIAALRSLLRYLYVHGELERDLSGAVPSAATWRLAGLPKFLTPDDTISLLGSQDRRTPIGCRAHAVLLLLVRLGLRAGEVADLTLDDIYWSQGELLVRGKGGRQDRLPLPQEVGESIVSYLQRARPTSESRKLFLSSKAPHGPITSNAVSEIVRAAGGRSGIAGLRAHRLRHTAATHMLWNGASLAEIGQALRQEGVDTPAIYAKVDRNALRTICRPWPGAIS